MPVGGGGRQQGHHAGAVRAAVHVVAQMDQQGLGDRPQGDVFSDGGMDGQQAFQAAMHVAHGIDARAGRDGRRSREEIEHGGA